MKHLDLYITGRVQGVGYRAYVRKGAGLFGIFGLVKNEDDGSVFCEAEGSEEALNLFVQWCKQGPAFAKVENIQTVEQALINYQTFIISY